MFTDEPRLKVTANDWRCNASDKPAG